MAEAASLWGRAKQAFEARNLSEARQRALELLGTQPENSETHMLLGMIAAAERDWQQASEWLSRQSQAGDWSVVVERVAQELIAHLPARA